MRWRRAGTGMLLLMLMTGCPSEFGKDGRIAKAIHKDTVDLVIRQCSDDVRRQVCGNGQENTERCRRECG